MRKGNAMTTLRTRLDDRDALARADRDEPPTPGPALDSSDSPRPADRSNVKGLCRSCERRFDCSYPVTEAGVWNCEEYE